MLFRSNHIDRSRPFNALRGSTDIEEIGESEPGQISANSLLMDYYAAVAQRIAAQTNRLVLVHFWGTWCPPCMEMEKSVFSKPGLGTAVNPYYVPVKIQVEED